MDAIYSKAAVKAIAVVKHFVPVGLEDVASADDLEAHDTAIREYKAGETVAHAEIDWN